MTGHRIYMIPLIPLTIQDRESWFLYGKEGRYYGYRSKKKL